MLKMKKKNKKIFIISIIVLFILGIFLMNKYFKSLSILPGLDNRITYYDNPTDVSQTVDAYYNPSPEVLSYTGQPNKPYTIYENDKFIMTIKTGWDGNVYYKDEIIVYCGQNGYTDLITKKDFSRLKSYLRVLNDESGRLIIRVNLGESSSVDIILPIGQGVYTNLEIIPDNLNVGVYNIFIDSEFYKRITNVNTLKFYFDAICGNYAGIRIDYIKYVPDEAFTIRNDEVWVQEVRGSGSYSIKGVGDKNNDLRWEMIGFKTNFRYIGTYLSPT